MRQRKPNILLHHFYRTRWGTLIGAFVAVRIAASHHKIFAYTIAGLFFLGGLYMVLILNAPMWFNITDLVLAYFPMAWLALRLNKVK